MSSTHEFIGVPTIVPTESLQRPYSVPTVPTNDPRLPHTSACALAHQRIVDGDGCHTLDLRRADEVEFGGHQTWHHEDDRSAGSKSGHTRRISN